MPEPESAFSEGETQNVTNVKELQTLHLNYGITSDKILFYE